MAGSKPFFSALLNDDTFVYEQRLTWWDRLWSLIPFGNAAEKRKMAFHSNFGGLPPQGVLHPFLKTRQITFNHVFSFYLDAENQIWYAPRIHPEQPPNWKPLYFDGLHVSNQDQMEIIADGANLMAAVTINGKTTIHYKKVLAEKRIKQLDGKLNYLVHNLCEEPHAITEWFSLPFIKYLKFREWGKRLTLQPGATWAMSHVGDFKYHSLHPSGIAHSIWGTTTLYEIVEDVIRLHDPFVSVDSVLEIALPHSDQNIFNLKSVDASGSVILLLGDEIETQTDGSKVSKPVIYTKLLDYDVMGCNPLQQCTHDPHSSKRFIRVPRWQKHDLPSGQINGTVTVLQTGIDYHATEIRISGQSDNKSGFFYKALQEDSWSFQEHSEKTFLTRRCSEPMLRSSSGIQLNHHQAFSINGHAFQSACCNSFHEKAIHLPLTVIDSQDNTIQMHLHRRRNLIKAFFGLESDYWHLVLDQTSLNYRHLFRGNLSIPVHLSIPKGDSEELILSSSSHAFYLKASKVNSPDLNECYNTDVLSSSATYIPNNRIERAPISRALSESMPDTMPTPPRPF